MSARPVSPAEMLLAARLLEVAAREFHEHGCNDMDLSLLAGIDFGDLVVMASAFNRWNGSDREPVLLDAIQDDQWMEFLAARLRGQA